MGEARTLSDIFYPPRTVRSSLFNILALENVTLELKPQCANMLSKFMGIDDT